MSSRSDEMNATVHILFSAMPILSGGRGRPALVGHQRCLSAAIFKRGLAVAPSAVIMPSSDERHGVHPVRFHERRQLCALKIIDGDVHRGGRARRWWRPTRPGSVTDWWPWATSRVYRASASKLASTRSLVAGPMMADTPT